MTNQDTLLGLANTWTANQIFASGVQSTSLMWKDWAAISYAKGNVGPYGIESNHTHASPTLSDPGHQHCLDETCGTTTMIGPGYDGTTGITINNDVGENGAINVWHPNNTNHPTHLTCLENGITCNFDVPFMPGTILTRLRVKWQAVGANDGVKVRLLKRDESGTGTSYTVVGAEQTYTDTAPFDVIVSTYDVADETITENYSYQIEVTSVKATSGVNLYSIGIESNKRVY